MPSTADSLQLQWQQTIYENTQFVANSSWWYNPTNHNSLRLTKPSFNQLKSKIKFHKFILPEPMRITLKMLIQLERQFKEPYYLHNDNTIHVISEQDAMMLILHANNLQTYLDILSS